jgi:hypothetical protein
MTYLALADPVARNVAWAHAGFACECMLKAAIMAHERLNAWPDRSSRPELYTHRLDQLAKVLGLQIGPTDEIAAAWAAVLDWRREHAYVSDQIPAPVLIDLIEAVFSEGGIIPWLSQRYLQSYCGRDGSITSP